MKKGLAPFVSLHQRKLLIAPLSRPSSTQNDVDVKRCLRILRGTVWSVKIPHNEHPGRGCIRVFRPRWLTRVPFWSREACHHFSTRAHSYTGPEGEQGHFLENCDAAHVMSRTALRYTFVKEVSMEAVFDTVRVGTFRRHSNSQFSFVPSKT